jgi:hypothetical protein
MLKSDEWSCKEITRMTRTQKQTRSDNGFAIPLQPDTDLGLAILMVEDEEGHSEPIAVVGTISEAKEAARSDFRDRTRRLDRGEDAGLCPSQYKLWARGIDGEYLVASNIDDILA